MAKATNENKFAYFVRLYVGRGAGAVRYITKARGSWLEWKEDEKPLPMSKALAEEVLFRLVINFETAEIVYERVGNVDTQQAYINGWLNDINEERTKGEDEE